MKEITVDIDEKYDEWYKSDFGFKTIRDKIYNKLAGVQSSYVRRSSGNHVHVKVKFGRELSLLESLAIRAFLDDDPMRIACDLDRLYRTGDIKQTGRCFDEKYTKGQVRKAGVWMRL